ncbi:MAG: TetR/AcrR family transcriptional regulator [Eubacteriales bacterium]|nr:TetR/AcrR family transcriptional regulator [Eubacteriales bacterium]
MARQAVLSGGKRDELMDAAIRLFLQHGYEGTSVRMILQEVGGEIGMFYHYFKSKDALFEAALERYLVRYTAGFHALATDGSLSPLGQVGRIMAHFRGALSEYGTLLGHSAGKLTFPLKEALHSRTIDALVPCVEAILQNTEKCGLLHAPPGVLPHELALFVLHGFAGVMDLVNEKSALPDAEYQRRLQSAAALLSPLLGIPCEQLNAALQSTD